MIWILDKSAHVRLVAGEHDLAHHRGMWHRTPLPDLFIAETAIHHGAGVLHRDRDYARIAQVRPGFTAREFD
ncbi:MAG: hypothetical protein E6R06_25220 [Mycobacterium sp.]|nr:MAG: hypothetical protein E6R06_25220 [Mycobacterium sp.]